MSFELENYSGYHTGDLRRFFEAAMAATGTVRNNLRIIVVAAPSRSRGCADVGGNRMIIAIAAPWRFSLGRLARLTAHELAHIRGIEHERMPRFRCGTRWCDLLYSLGATIPRWARGMRIRYLRRAPAQLPILGRMMHDRGATARVPSRRRHVSPDLGWKEDDMAHVPSRRCN